MRRTNKLLALALTFIFIQVASIGIIQSQANATLEPALGVTRDYQIVSGGATTIGGAVTGLEPTHITSSTPAISDLSSAIATLLASPGVSVAADLGGKTFTPGTYLAAGGAAFAMTSGVILDGNNDCNSIFIFVTPAAMNTTAGVSVTLINDAQPNNVYWVVGAATTIAASSILSGNFLSSAAITVGASSIIDGRFLAMAAITVGASVAFQGFPITGCSAPTGSLSIAVPADVEPKILKAGETLTIEIGQVVVTDTRGIATGATWSVAAKSNEFIDGAGNILGAENLGYSMRLIATTGGLTLSEYTLSSMLSLSPILVATAGAGLNSATWAPILTISVPVDQYGGTYTGSIIHSFY